MRALVQTSTGTILRTAMRFTERTIYEMTGVKTGVQIGPIPDTDFAIIGIKYLPAPVPPLPYQTQGQEAPVYADGTVTVQMTVIDMTLEQATAQAWEEVKQIRERVYDYTKYNNLWFTTSKDDKANLAGAIATDQPARYQTDQKTFVWLSVDNQPLVATTTEPLIGLQQAGADRIADAFANSQKLRGVINATTTVDELRQLDFTVGWPEIYAPVTAQ